jgi:hypothetical protein
MLIKLKSFQTVLSYCRAMPMFERFNFKSTGYINHSITC